MISGKGVHMYKGDGGGALIFWFYLIFINTDELSHENEIIWSPWDQIISFS